MASRREPAANSRLTQMQMRFQQKQQQERDQKKMEIRGASVAEEQPTKVVNGKVRQMFDERRRVVAGIDRSQPLKPISMTTRTTTNTTTAPGTTARTVRKITTTTATTPLAQKPNAARRSTTIDNQRNVTKVSRSIAHTDEVDNESFVKGFSSLSLGEYSISDRNNNNNIKNSGYNRLSSAKISSNLKPVITKKTPPMVSPPLQTRNTGQRLNSTSAALRSSKNFGQDGGDGIQKRQADPIIKSQNAKDKFTTPVGKVSLSIKPAPRMATPPDGMSTCRYCHRNFNNDRLPKHEMVCQKMAKTKRKIFDASKQRIDGTDTEKFAKKGPRTPRYTSLARVEGLSIGVKKSNWRKKHEEFIQSIRAAKQVQAHLARGGKLSDLPPPPPSDTSDYIQCPHCNRRFNQQAAERHIPKCANMLHNKPKPGQKR